MWSKVGCITPLKADFIQWYSTQTKAKAFADMGYWATATDDDHRSACYGTDKTKWPGATGPTGTTNPVGYIYSTPIAGKQVCNVSDSAKVIATIKDLPVGVWAITYQVNFTDFNKTPMRIKTAVGTTAGGRDVAGILITQVSVNDYQGSCSTIYFSNNKIRSIYLNVSNNPGESCTTYTESDNTSYFQAIKIA